MKKSSSNKKYYDILRSKISIYNPMHIPSPDEILSNIPLSVKTIEFIKKSRNTASDILNKKSPKLAVLLGPCSIHDPISALEYAKKILEISKLTPNLFLIMRVFLEKPRSLKGWTGLVYDPKLDASHDINFGIQSGRSILKQILELEIPCASEFLDPFLVPYFQDCITWAMIGARTSGSQPHRQLASNLPYPVGFKNDVHGNLDVAIQAILSAQESHHFLTIDSKGFITAKKSQGNPNSCLVLRGAVNHKNFDKDSVQIAEDLLQKHNLPTRLMIDCSHGNSQKDHKKQGAVFIDIIKQIQMGNSSIRACMLESHLFEGKQKLLANPLDLKYGISITDACLGWEETKELLIQANDSLNLSGSYLN